MDEQLKNTASDGPPISDQELKAAKLEVLTLVADRLHSQDRWGRTKRLALLGTIGAIVLFCMAQTAGEMWSTAHPTDRVVVIPINGPIEAGGNNGGDRLVPIVRAACKDATVKGLVFRINSPGGSAGEAERVGAAIELCRTGANIKPVVAVIDGLGASAAYLLAIQADEVIASRYAMVGSIGTVMKNVDFSSLGSRLGVREEVYASGALKAWGSSLRTNSPEQSQMLQSVVDRAAKEFALEVKARRGKKLLPTPDMFSGRVWLAGEAKDIGLIDQVGMIDSVMDSRFDGLPVVVMTPKQTLGEQLGLKAMIVDALKSSSTTPVWQ
jgi:protease-4